MTEREIQEHAEYEAILRAKIESGEMTPDEAAVEWDFHFNGMDSYQNIYGW